MEMLSEQNGLLKRNRLPNNTPYKPTDKSVNFDICVKYNENVTGDCVACTWYMQWVQWQCLCEYQK